MSYAGESDQRPVSFMHQEAMIAHMIIVVASQKREDQATPQFAEIPGNVIAELADAVSQLRVGTRVTLRKAQ